MDIVGLEILHAVGRFFLHPYTYVFLLVMLWFGMRRAKRERKDFHTRVHDVIQNVLSPLGIGLIFAVLISAVALAAGIGIPPGMLVLWACIWLVLVPFRHARWLSMTTAGAAAVVIAPFLPDGGTGITLVNNWLNDIQGMNLLHAAWLLTVLFVAESLLVYVDGWRQASPAVVKSKRGKLIGGHKLSRLWFLPVFMLFPTGNLTEVGWWPVIELAEGQTFGLALFPFLLGLQMSVYSELPVDSVRKIGKRLLVLALSVTALAVGAYFYPPLLFAIPAAVLAGRELIFILHKSGDQSRVSLFARQEEGLKILGILPGSTAEKMGLQSGEIIVKTNGREIYSQRSFYDALQQNPAFCKLEVVDHNGEIRFSQSSVFENDHYQAGCLFVPDDEFGNLSFKALRSSVVIHQDRAESGARQELETDVQSDKESAAADENTESSSTESSSVADDEVSKNEEPAEEKMAEVGPAEEINENENDESGQNEPQRENDEKETPLDKEAFYKSAKEAYQSGAPYGQAAGLSSFYDEFRETKTERIKWRPKIDDEKGTDHEQNKEK